MKHNTTPRKASDRTKGEYQRQVALTGVVALAVLAALLILLRLPTGEKTDIVPAASVSPEITLACTSVCTPMATIVPVPAPTAGPWKEMLPVITLVDTDKKQIAITIDDLNEVDNLNELMELAVEYSAKLTLFPIGEVVDHKADLRAALKRAYELGFEIENHTYSHVDLFSLTDSEMAEQIVRQNQAVNNALGLDYEMHFLRMKGGNGEYDLRSHMYLIQNGYKGIVDWHWSGTSVSAARSRDAVKNGAVYLFHTKDKDIEKLKLLIPYFAAEGYEMVTLNELIGLEPNAVKPLIGDAKEYPVPEPMEFIYNEENYVLIGKKYYTQMYAVQLLQKRLMELNYLDNDAKVDGDYGSVTREAVMLFQKVNGLDVDGLAGVQTQNKLFSDEALSCP